MRVSKIMVVADVLNVPGPQKKIAKKNLKKVYIKFTNGLWMSHEHSKTRIQGEKSLH